jgi:hypothetical protein
MTPIEDRTGSKPISPIPTSIPIRQTLNFVTLNDIRLLFTCSNYYYYPQHPLIQIEVFFTISVMELISHNGINSIFP